jgi:hypothetical protein
MIPINEFPALFAVRDGSGRETWCACKVVGLTTDLYEPKFVVMVDDVGAVYAMTVSEVRRPEPTAEPFG